MEPSQFDEFTKSMATPTSRRQALKRLVAGTFGSLLALSGIGTAFAKKCPPGLTDCGGKCVDTKKDPNNCGVCGTKCKSGLCVNGLCCPPGAFKCGNSCCSFTCCGGNTCVNTQTDRKNCGTCGHVCSAGHLCKNGQCIATLCKPGCKVLCNGTCAQSCDQTDCTCGSICAFDNSGQVCSPGGPPNGTCKTDCDCPTGYFCSIDGLCFKACC